MLLLLLVLGQTGNATKPYSFNVKVLLLVIHVYIYIYLYGYIDFCVFYT